MLHASVHAEAWQEQESACRQFCQQDGWDGFFELCVHAPRAETFLLYSFKIKKRLMITHRTQFVMYSIERSILRITPAPTGFSRAFVLLYSCTVCIPPHNMKLCSFYSSLRSLLHHLRPLWPALSWPSTGHHFVDIFFCAAQCVAPLRH